MSQWTCSICNHSYRTGDGDVSHGVLSGTDWENLPEDWCCPDCGAAKFEFHQTVDGAAAASGWIVT